MIKVLDKYFILDTENTTYCFNINEAGNPVHLYYGTKVSLDEPSLRAITPIPLNPIGTGCALDDDYPNIFLDDCCLEISTKGKGDSKEPLVEFEYPNGSSTSDFRYKDYDIIDGNVNPLNLPNAYDGDQTLVLKLIDKNSSLELDLVYTVYESSNCITRFTRVHSNKEQVKVERLMSSQLDTYKSELKAITFHGEWTREMDKFETLVQAGKYISDSNTGNSSNKSNPFVMLADKETNETAGEVYASNLIYSGNHREYFEINNHHKTHFLTGINPDYFYYCLKENEILDSPVAVMTYSNEGYKNISVNMHRFVRNHIVRGEWKDKDRPVLLNSWEANYFNITDKKLIKLAKSAKDVGAELFVMDDGWFGERNNDKSSLGDWYSNSKKLPNGLEGLEKEIHKLGLMFGIWVEPEMVNEDSNLYRVHPDWVVKIPDIKQALGRNQMVLDLSKDDVCNYIIESMSDVFTKGNVDYVKWDMNRNISDNYSINAGYDQKEFPHRYILGLYKILEELNKRFPKVLFEACASGGNRFDLGMLCYMPQIWASDDSDAVMRGFMQNNYSYGYPQSVIGAHVSDCPNHQTIRVTPLRSRYAIASAGLLGYELNLNDLQAEELKAIKEQIEQYKKFRHTLQFGQLYRLIDSKVNKHLESDVCKWIIVSDNQKEAVGIILQGLAIPNYSHRSFKTIGLNDEFNYHFYNIPTKHDIHIMGGLINTMAPIHIKQDSLVHDVVAKFYKLDSEIEDHVVKGDVLNNIGIPLADVFAGTGYGPNTSIYSDFDSKVFYIEAVE